MGSTGTEARRADERVAPTENELLRCRGWRKLPPIGSGLAASDSFGAAEISEVDDGTMVLRHRSRCSGVICMSGEQLVWFLIRTSRSA